MKHPNNKHLKTLSLVSLLYMLIPASILGLWIYVCDVVATHTERVVAFKSYFPDFLHGRWDTTLLSMSFCLSSIILSSKGLKLPGKFWWTLNTSILTISSLLLFLNLWSMM